MSLYNCTCTWSTSTCNDSFKLSEISDYPRLLVTCTSLTVCLLCIYLAHGRQTLIEVFNNIANSEVQSPTDNWVFRQLWLMIMATVNEPWNTGGNNKQNGSKSTNHDRKMQPFDPAEVSFCFLRGLLRRLTAAENVNRCWGLSFRVRMLL